MPDFNASNFHFPELPDGEKCTVAFSGGADSMALLGLACEAYGAGRVFAIHINHQLQEASESFESQCQDACKRLGCELAIERVDAHNAPRESPEAAARGARYAALSERTLAYGASFCLLGQHAQDQVETLILALARGLGLAGISGMGENFERHGALYARPFLEASPEDLRTVCNARGWTWIEDPSNADPRYTRNLTRAVAIPALEKCFPKFPKAAARSMRHAAQAQSLLTDLALIDLEANPSMLLSKLRALTDPRQANLLRHWLKNQGAHPTESQLSEALSQIRATSDGSRSIDIKCGPGRLAKDGKILAYRAPATLKPSKKPKA